MRIHSPAGAKQKFEAPDIYRSYCNYISTAEKQLLPTLPVISTVFVAVQLGHLKKKFVFISISDVARRLRNGAS